MSCPALSLNTLVVVRHPLLPGTLKMPEEKIESIVETEPEGLGFV